MAGDSTLHPSPAPSETTSVAEPMTMLLRIWTGKTAQPMECRWGGPQPWIAMLRQAVLSSGGTTREPETGESGLLAVDAASTSAAARVARRLQALTAGYAAETGGDLLGVSILICPRSVADKPALCRYLRQKARPAQTLLAVKRMSAPVEAHRMDDALFGELAVYDLPYAHRDEAGKTAEALLAKSSNQPSPPVPASAPVTKSEAAVRRFGPLSASPRNAVAFVAAALAIVAGAAIAFRPAKQPVPAMRTPAPPFVKPAPPPAVADTPPAPQPAPQPAKIDHVKRPSPPAELIGPAEKPRRGRGDLTSEQIRQILTRGQNALDRGCYTEAIGYYRRVLADDPGNGPAVSGSEKARVRMRLSGENAQCSR